MKLEYKRNVWDKEQKRFVSPITISDGDKFIAIDAKALKGKYAVLEAVGLMLKELEELEPCDHENTEHHESGDIHPRSLPYTECLDCGIEIDTEPLFPEDVAE